MKGDRTARTANICPFIVSNQGAVNFKEISGNLERVERIAAVGH